MISNNQLITVIISAFVMLDCTSELRCGVGKSIAVIN